jgi:hypothetical protein
MIRRTPWTQQPKIAAGVNPQFSPSGLWNFSGTVDAVTGKQATVNGTYCTPTVTQSGRALSVAGTGSIDRVILNNSADAIGSGEFTVLLRFSCVVSANAYVAVGRWTGGGTPTTSEWYLGAGSSFSVATCDFGIACGSAVNGASATVPGGWVSGQEYTLVGRRKGTTIYVDLFVGAANVASGSLTTGTITTVNRNAALNLGLGEFAGAGAAFNLDIKANVLALFPASLSDYAVSSLAATPWQLFAPMARQFPGSANADVFYPIFYIRA